MTEEKTTQTKRRTEMELKVQGYMLTPGILEALTEWVDKDTTTFDIVGREEELLYELAENIITPLHLLKDFLKPIKEVIVTIEPFNPDEEDDTLLAVQVKVIFEDGDIYETHEATLDVADYDSFGLTEVYRELFLVQIENEGGRNHTVVYSDYRNVLNPFDTPPYVDFDGRLYMASWYCEEYKKLEKEIDDEEDESRLRECLHEAANFWWCDYGLESLEEQINALRFADFWHVQHYKGKYWYAFLVMGEDIYTTGDVFGGVHVCGLFAVDIPYHLLSDAAKQDIKAMEKIFENQLCTIGCDAVAMFGG